MTTVGFIGSGKIGGTVARLALAAGHDVVLSNSRGPETLAELVGELGPHARAATAAEAAGADLVVVSVPFHAYRQLPPLSGRVVLDTNNYYPARDGHVAEIDDGKLTSAEIEQQHLAGAKLVKVFNNIFWRHLGSLSRPAGAPDRTALPIAGDDPEAKRAVATFLDEIGYDTVDVGTLADSWRFEPGQPAYGSPYGTFDDPAGTPANVDVVRAAVAEASR
jgi:predicted dinucleotide-binding enzyme